MARLTREQQTRQKRLAWIRSLPDENKQGAKASKYVWHVNDFIKKYPDQKEGVLLCRVSKRDQWKKGNLKRQAKGLKQLYKDNFDITMVETFKEIGSGSNPLEDRDVFNKAAKTAGRLGVPLCIGCMSRAARHPSWKSNDQDWQPTSKQLRDLIKHIEKYNVKHLVCYAHPDSTPQEDNGFLSLLNRTALGTEHKGRTPTMYRGYKRDQKANSIDTVLQMHKEGYGCRKIAKAVEHLTGHPIYRSTVLRWIKKHVGSHLSRSPATTL